MFSWSFDTRPVKWMDKFWKVLLSSFHLNGHTLVCYPQTQKLETPCRVKQHHRKELFSLAFTWLITLYDFIQKLKSETSLPFHASSFNCVQWNIKHKGGLYIHFDMFKYLFLFLCHRCLIRERLGMWNKGFLFPVMWLSLLQSDDSCPRLQRECKLLDRKWQNYTWHDMATSEGKCKGQCWPGFTAYQEFNMSMHPYTLHK